MKILLLKYNILNDKFEYYNKDFHLFDNCIKNAHITYSRGISSIYRNSTHNFVKF